MLGSNAAGDYHAFVDVTARSRPRETGSTPSPTSRPTTGTDRYAGWSLVVAYRDPTSIPRNLTVFDGFADVDATTPNVTIPSAGSRPRPPARSTPAVGVVAYEGDLGLTGDSLSLNSTILTNARNPVE